MAPKADFASLPDGSALGLALADAHHHGIVWTDDLDDTRQEVGNFLGRALDLNDQQSLDVERIAGLGESLAHLDGGLVHELDGNRNDTGRNDG